MKFLLFKNGKPFKELPLSGAYLFGADMIPLRHVERIESHYTEPNGLTLSPVVYFDLGTKLEKFFEPYRVSNEQFVYRYKLAWE